MEMFHWKVKLLDRQKLWMCSSLQNAIVIVKIQQKKPSHQDSSVRESAKKWVISGD